MTETSPEWNSSMELNVGVLLGVHIDQIYYELYYVCRRSKILKTASPCKQRGEGCFMFPSPATNASSPLRAW